MLKLEQVSKTFYPNTGNEKCAMDHLDLLIHTGEFVTVIGSNGAGKSTLFNLDVYKRQLFSFRPIIVLIFLA